MNTSVIFCHAGGLKMLNYRVHCNTLSLLFPDDKYVISGFSLAPVDLAICDLQLISFITLDSISGFSRISGIYIQGLIFSLSSCLVQLF